MNTLILENLAWYLPFDPLVAMKCLVRMHQLVVRKRSQSE